MLTLANAIAYTEKLTGGKVVKAIENSVDGIPCIDVWFVCNGREECMTVWLEGGEVYGEW